MKASSRGSRRNPSRVVPEVTERFTGKVQTKYGGAGLLRRFVHKLGLPARLAKLGEGQCALGQYLLCVLFGLLLGLQRQSEIAQLRQDPAALLALGLEKMPSQPALSRFFAGGTRQLGRKLLGLNTELVRNLREGRVGATLDLDGQVVVARGNPGGASFGYNPKRKGAKSYFIMMGFWGEVRDIVAAELFGGHRASVSAQMAKDTYRQSRQALPASVLRVRLRADCGFYSDEFLKCLEGDKVTYAVAARLTAPVKARVAGLDYQPLNDKWGLAEFEYRGHGWKHSRRMVVVRSASIRRTRTASSCRCLSATVTPTKSSPPTRRGRRCASGASTTIARAWKTSSRRANTISAPITSSANEWAATPLGSRSVSWPITPPTGCARRCWGSAATATWRTG